MNLLYIQNKCFDRNTFAKGVYKIHYDYKIMNLFLFSLFILGYENLIC